MTLQLEKVEVNLVIRNIIFFSHSNAIRASNRISFQT